MPFTTAQLADRMNHDQLVEWSNSAPHNQQEFLNGFTVYFNELQAWITQHGGANPFGWNAIAGLTHNNGVQVVLQGPQQRAPFNDAFNDVRMHLGNPDFRLFQAAEAIRRLIRFLGVLG